MGYLNNSGLTRFWNAIKSKFIRTINGIGPDTNGNVSVDTCEYIAGTQTGQTNAFTGVTHDSALYNGKHIFYRLPYAGTSTAATMNLTLADGTTTGALPVYYVAGSRLTTHYGANNVIGMTYVAADNAWYCDADRDTDSYAYALRASYNIYKTYTNLYRYQVCFTKDNEYILPANAVSNDTGTTKQLTTEEFDPFGEIYWYWTTTTISAGSVPTGTNLVYNYWLVDLRYSFNAGQTLTAKKDVYIVCVPQKNGKVKLANPAITQELPTTEDGLVYIRFGKAYDTYRVEMGINKPVYYYANGEIREWTNSPADAKLAEYNTDEDVFQIRHAKAEKPSYNSEVIRKITGGTLAWNQLVPPLDSSNYSFTRSTGSFSDGVATFTGSQQYSGLINSSSVGQVIKNHVYIRSFDVKLDNLGDGTGFIYWPINNMSDLTVYINTLTAGQWKTVSRVQKATDSYSNNFQRIIFDGRGSNWTAVSIKNIVGFDLTLMFGSTIADRIYALEQATAGAGVAWFRRYFNRDYYEPAQTLAHTYFDEYYTTGFNLYNGAPILGKYWNNGTLASMGSNAHAATENKVRCIPNAAYCVSFPNAVKTHDRVFVTSFDADGNFLRTAYSDVATASKYVFTTDSDCHMFAISFYTDSSTFADGDFNSFCINLSDASRNGQYEPYRHSRLTFFDNPVRLRGIPYLDENDNLRFNGDIWEANRKINRRYGIVDLGTLPWTKSSSVTGAFATTIPESLAAPYKYASGVEMRCGAYAFDGHGNYSNGYYGANGTIRYYYSESGAVAREVYVTDVSKDSLTAAQFKTAMSGVMLVYELETPTEEEFTPIDGPLASDPLGLESISKSDWGDIPTLAQMDILYANEVRANVEMIATNKVIASQNSAKDLSKCITVKPGTLLPSGTDLNTVKVFGEYYLQGPDTRYSYTNAAFSGNSKLLVIDMQGSDYDDPMYNGGVMQIQIGEIYDSTTGVRTNKAYSRIYYSGTTWSSWKPIQGGSGLFYGSSATAAGTGTKDVVCPEFTAVDLVPGTTISVKFDNTNSAAVGNLALNVNGTGAHNVKHVYNGSYSNIPGAGYIKAGQLYLFTYDGTYWVVQMMYNTNIPPYQLYLVDAKRKAYTNLYRYQVCFTKDEEYILPANAVDNNTGTSKQLTTESFDPFGPIFFYYSSTTVAADGVTASSSLYFATSAVTLQYAFNTGTSLVANKQVYLKCSPQSDGKVKMASTNPIVQALPTIEDGYVYILLGVAYDNYRICFYAAKPIYHCINGGNIVPWHGFETLQSTDITIANGDKLVVTDASDNSKVARTSIAFDGSTTTQVLSKKGTWVTLPSQQTVPEPATATPLPPTTVGAVGTATKYAREDHVHPSDPTKASSTHTHGNITNAGALQTTDITIANGDKLVVTDSDNSGKVARTSIAFDGSTTTQVLSKKGTWVSLPSTPTAAGVTDVPQPDAAIGDVGTSTKYARADHVHPTSVHGIPSGGTTGQFLTKSSNTDYDVAWVTVPNANGVSF